MTIWVFLQCVQIWSFQHGEREDRSAAGSVGRESRTRRGGRCPIQGPREMDQTAAQLAGHRLQQNDLISSLVFLLHNFVPQLFASIFIVDGVVNFIDYVHCSMP